ncbi:MAG: c-type cytochrome biogenesis protein CcsB [Candidatus Aminicenantes bacterium RBG_13_63_10]|nr:MAG: c-type cytochrome biogenesis protein CcsB [Candidatus Aminicenantes bacterium RBG_13_63_10]
MNESFYFQSALVLYVLSAAGYLIFQLRRRRVFSEVGWIAGLIGLALHTGALVLRTLVSGHAPFTNMYESLSFLAWSCLLAYLVMDRLFNLPRAGFFLLLFVLAFMLLANSPLMSKDITPLMPALQSYWLWLHVSITLLGEAFFAVAFITSLMYLFASSSRNKAPSEKTIAAAEKLDRASYRCIAVGFPLFSLGGLVLGMVWAHKAWGAYWSWDPKEVWSLVTWFVYALYLHTRLVMGWKGRRSAVIAVIGFLAALFTYFGVNYLLSGLHSYA